MILLSTALIIFLSIFSLITSQNSALKFNNLTVEVFNQSKIFVITNKYKNNITGYNETYTFQLNSLVERDINGTAIGGQDHQINFSNVKFKVGNFEEGHNGNVSLSLIELNTFQDLNTNFTMSIYVGIYQQAGSIQYNYNKTLEMLPGQMEINYKIFNWTFCQNLTLPCNGKNCCVQGNQTQIGAYLDLSFNVTGQSNVTSIGGNVFSLGYSNITFSNYTYLENKSDPTPLPANYPSYQNDGANGLFTIRIPKFNQSAIYRQYLKMNVNYVPNGSSLWIIIGFVVGIFAILLAVFFIMRYFRRNRRQEALMP
jgi:hypothetical protein